MTKKNVLVLAVCLIGMGHCFYEVDAVDFAYPPLATGRAPADPYYCPPGAKFCPAPGSENTVFMDTHFGVDAKTGEMTAYKGTAHPDDVVNPPMTGERVLYVAPPISVENRYVPYPGAPQANMGDGVEYLAQPGSVYYSQDMNQFARTQSPSRRAAHSVAESEVANKQADRSSSDIAIAQTAEKPWWKGGLWSHNDDPIQGERTPWWKGGMWRNRKQNEPTTVPSRSKSSSSSPSSAADDDIWGDENYDDYNPNDSFDGGNNSHRQAPNDLFAAPVYDSGPDAAQNQYYDPYGQPYAGGNVGGFVGEAYTLPDSPSPTSPYQDGYFYSDTNLTASSYQGGYAPKYQPQHPAMSAPPQTTSAFLPPPTASAISPAAMSSSGGSGSLQLENAKRMVKEDRFTEAKNLLMDETRSNPGSAEAWRWLADCHYNLLELDDAINAYQRALRADPNDYYALRGQGFSYLHRGHEFWRRMQEQVAKGEKEQAAHTFTQAHENYKKALELLGLCLRRAPNDGEAIYGEAMAAEGASRKLYSNAISFIKLGPEQRERAEVFAENCLTVINKGIERSREKAKLSPGDVGPRALMGGLYLRKAILYNQLGKNDLALLELKSSRDAQQSILDEIDKNNTIAQKNIQECENLWNAWGGNRN